MSNDEFDIPGVFKHLSEAPPMFKWMWGSTCLSTLIVLGLSATHIAQLIRIAISIRNYREKTFIPSLASIHIKILAFFFLSSFCTWASLIFIRFATLFQLILHLYEAMCLQWFWRLLCNLFGDSESAYTVLHTITSYSPHDIQHLRKQYIQFVKDMTVQIPELGVPPLCPDPHHDAGETYLRFESARGSWELEDLHPSSSRKPKSDYLATTASSHRDSEPSLLDPGQWDRRSSFCQDEPQGIRPLPSGDPKEYASPPDVKDELPRAPKPSIHVPSFYRKTSLLASFENTPHLHRSVYRDYEMFKKFQQTKDTCSPGDQSQILEQCTPSRVSLISFFNQIKFGHYHVLWPLPRTCGRELGVRAFTKNDLRVSFRCVAQYIIIAALTVLSRILSENFLVGFQVVAILSLTICMYGILILLRGTLRVFSNREMKLGWKLFVLKTLVFIIKGSEVLFIHLIRVPPAQAPYSSAVVRLAWANTVINLSCLPLVVIASRVYPTKDLLQHCFSNQFRLYSVIEFLSLQSVRRP